MARKPKVRPSFFKVLIKDFTTRLSLPHAFVQRFGKFLPESAKLRASSSSGETWDVKLEQIDDDEKRCCCFVGGWSKFAKDLELKLGEFLVFWFNAAESTFDVSVYAINSCEREISAKNLRVDVDSDADEDSDEFRNEYCNNVADVRKKRPRSYIPYKSEAAGTDDGDDKSGNSGKEIHPRFEIVLTDTRKSRLCVPKLFAEATGLMGKRAVVLEHPPKRRYWPVLLDQSPRRYFNLQLAMGWNDFRKENELVIGKTYSFEFDPTRNVIQVKEHKKRRTLR